MAVERLAMPKKLSGRRLRKSGEHTEERGLTASGRSEERDDFPGFDCQTRRTDNLHACAVGLRIGLLDRYGLNDRFAQAKTPVISIHDSHGKRVCFNTLFTNRELRAAQE